MPLCRLICKISNSAGKKSTRGSTRHKREEKEKSWRKTKQTQNIHPPESTLACLCVNEHVSGYVRSATAAVGVFLGAVRAGARNMETNAALCNCSMNHP